MEFNAANVERAVLDFYASGQSNHEWLTNAQLSAEAWGFAWELIQQGKSPQVQFFGANTLALKVSKCFQEVPQGDFPLLREKLVGLLQVAAAKGPKIVATRLCVAVAAMVIHSVPNAWGTPISDLISLLQNEVQQKGISVLPTYLELLTIIPEEFATQVMTSNRRATVRAQLGESLGHILNMISQIFRDKKALPSESVVQAIKCLQSWIQFGVPVEITENIFDKVLEGVGNEELFDCSLEALTSIILHPNTYTHPNAMKRLLVKVLTLEPMFEKMMKEETYDLITPLANLFIAFGETHSRLLLDWSTESEEGKMNSMKLVSLILQVSACKGQYPTQETISEMAFGFWYIFQDDIIACEPQQFQHCVGVFGSAYHSLVESLLKKAMYPLNDSDFSAEQKEQFRCYRTDVADTIMYCHNILRDDLLQILNSHLDDAIKKCQSQSDTFWPCLETCLYSWSAIGESMAEEEENVLLVQFLAKLPNIPYGNKVKVISAALDCIGGFAEWLANYPNLVINLIPVVTSAIGTPELSLSATMALKDMARDCTETLRPCAGDIVNASVAALRSNKLKNGECIRLMYPIGKMLSLNSPSQVLGQLEPIIVPYLEELQNLLQQQPNADVKSRHMFVLKLMTTLFQALDIGKANENNAESQQSRQSRSEPISVLMPQILPLLKGTASKWTKDEEVMDCLWLFVKQSIPALMETNKPVVVELVDLISSCYAVAPHCMAIELGRHIVLLSENDPSIKPGLISLFARVSVKTMECLQQSSNPSEYSELAGVMFQNVAQLLKKNADYFGSQGIDPDSLFQCACFTISLPESSTVKYATYYITTVINMSHEHQYLRQIVQNQGEFLFRQLMTCIGGEKSRGHLEYYVDILFHLSKRFFDDLCKLMESFVREDNFPSSKVSRSEKEQFASLLLKERTNKRKMAEIVQEFALACLGLKG